MPIISGRINKLFSLRFTKKKQKIVKENFLTSEIIEKLKQAEREIENGEGIPAEEVFRELRQKYGFKKI